MLLGERGKYKSKLVTVVEGNPNGPFFISYQHRGVREGATPFPGALHFTLDLYLIMLSIKVASSTIF